MPNVPSSMLETLSTQHKVCFDSVLEPLNSLGFAVIDQVYADAFVAALRNECLALLPDFRAAAIKDGLHSNIRSDQILWLHANLKYAGQHLVYLQQLADALNRAFYLGIQELEAHFACYEAGSFYARHRDNPQQKNGRKISTVYYLHADWPTTAGGELHLQDRLGTWHLLQPVPNRMVIFDSDLLHEVLPARQQRLSVTAWLRNAAALW